MADAHLLAGRWWTARTCFDRCEQVSRQVGALELELTSRGMRHLLDSYDLAFTGSATGCQEVAERSRASGSLRSEAVARLSAAWAFLAVGDWEAALSQARRATNVADGIGAQRFSALGIAYGAIARARLGEPRSVEAELTRALALARSSGMRFSGPAVYAALLASAEDERLPALLEEADLVIVPECMSLMLVFFALYGVEAALKVGDLVRAAHYADLLEASMREESHALGALLIDFSRTLCAFQRDPRAEGGRREIELRQRLALAGMRPQLAFLEHSLEHSSSPWPRAALRESGPVE